MSLTVSRLTLTALLASVLFGTGAASAAGLEISPVSVELGGDESNAVIRLRNGDAEERRYQVQVFAWAESISGEMQLTPTKDLVFFPALLALKPGEDRNIRVGTVTPPGPVERSYRIFIEQMPASAKPGGASQVQVLARVGLPIFVAPTQVVEKSEIAELGMRDGGVSFAVRAGGTVHFRPTSLRLSGYGEGGKVIYTHDFNPWYVLAGEKRSYEVIIPSPLCREIRKLEVEAGTEKDALVARAATPHGACAP